MGSDALLARVGRHKQRYENHFRLVAGCVPYKLNQKSDRAGSLIDRIEVLMISTPNRHDLVFPKGGWENDETEEQAACREALEEAGVRGILRGKLGVWEFRSKSRQNSCSLEGGCRGSMYALEVAELLPSWPEKASHERRWLSVHEAWERCRYDWMRDALEKCLKHLSGEVVLPPLPPSPHPPPPPAAAAAAAAAAKSEPSIFCCIKPSENNRLESPINALC